MTIIFLTTILIVLVSFFLYKYIHKLNLYLYVLTAILAILALNGETNIITFGFVGFSFMAVVMFIGVLDRGILRKRLSLVRAELAIIGFIFLLPHAWVYIEYVLDDIGFFKAPFEFYMGVLALLVATPLYITSFPIVRKKFSFKQWKSIQRFSYLFFLLVGLHLILLQNVRMWLYISLFAVYAVFRVVLYIQKKRVSKKVHINNKMIKAS